MRVSLISNIKVFTKIQFLSRHKYSNYGVSLFFGEENVSTFKGLLYSKINKQKFNLKMIKVEYTFITFYFRFTFGAAYTCAMLLLFIWLIVYYMI